MLQLSLYYTPVPEEGRLEQGYGSSKKPYNTPCVKEKAGWRGIILQLSLSNTPMLREGRLEQGYGSSKKLCYTPMPG